MRDRPTATGCAAARQNCRRRCHRPGNAGFARRCGYSIAQGYLFARAMPMTALLAWLASGSGGALYACAIERAARSGAARPVPRLVRSERSAGK